MSRECATIHKLVLDRYNKEIGLVNITFRKRKIVISAAPKKGFSILEKPRGKTIEFFGSRGHIFKVEDLSFWVEDLKGGDPNFSGDLILGFRRDPQKIPVPSLPRTLKSPMLQK